MGSPIGARNGCVKESQCWGCVLFFGFLEVGGELARRTWSRNLIAKGISLDFGCSWEKNKVFKWPTTNNILRRKLNGKGKINLILVCLEFSNWKKEFAIGNWSVGAPIKDFLFCRRSGAARKSSHKIKRNDVVTLFLLAWLREVLFFRFGWLQRVLLFW